MIKIYLNNDDVLSMSMSDQRTQAEHVLVYYVVTLAVSISEHDNMGRDMTQNCIILPLLILTALNTLHLSNARRSRTRTHGSDDFSETTKSDNSGHMIP